MKKFRTMAAIAGVVALAVSGCSAADTGNTAADPDLLVEQGLSGMEPREIIDYLDQLPVAERPGDLIASVQPTELVLSDQDEEMALDLPAELTYVSVAPYVDQTHDCFYHSLTTCLGELRNAPVEVEIIEDGTGAVLVSEQATTFDNGFIGYWLPRDTAGTIEITHGEFTGYSYFTTGTDGATCITDLRLRASPLPQV